MSGLLPNICYLNAFPGFPDFSRFTTLRTLSEDQFPIGEFPPFSLAQAIESCLDGDDGHGRRVIVVGDIHGMDKPMQSVSLHTSWMSLTSSPSALLEKLSYNSSTDTLIHVGDIVSKGRHDGSMAVLSYMTRNNITGVRGNHDQKVIEWKTWLNWIQGQKGGRRWLDDIHQKWLVAENQGMDLDTWLDGEVTIDRTRWHKKIPKGWRLFSDHYKVAYDMSNAEYEYLLSCPLSLYVPSAHTYVVHAGLLSSDPQRKSTHPRQPLSHIPILPSILTQDKEDSKDTLFKLRRLQELSILHDIPQNADPWVLLNMRAILRDNSVSRYK